MNKRITSLALVFVMVLSLLVTAVPALAAPIESTQLKVTADKTSAKPGDTITYTITMGPVSDMGSMQMCLDIPTGLTYVENSTELADGLKATLGFDDVAWTEISKMINGVASAADYESNTDTVIAKFQCTVDADFSGTAEVGLTNLEFGSCQTFEYHTDRFSVVKASVTVTVPHTHVYDQTNTDAAHLKTKATCTEAAVYYKSCTCGENGTETFTSGSALGHDYTKKVENNTYLKTAASNCTEYNVYWYACSRCDANAKDDAAATDKYYTSTTAGNHSFTEKIEDAAHYVADTGTNCLSVKQYYYDCAYCDQIGTATWDSTTYGEHNYAATWSSDADSHWHECSLCHGKKDEAAHTPGAAATETTPQKCTECDYTITPALGHTHNMTPVAAKAATCTEDGNKAYYTCSCGMWFEDAAGSTEITDHDSVVIGKLGHNWVDATCTAPKTCSRCDATEGKPNGHTEGTDWKNDANYHWHICSVDGCGAVIESSKAAHTPDHTGHATEEYAIKCSVCDYVIEAQLGHTHVFDKEVATDAYKASDATCTAKATYYKSCACGEKGTETFEYGELAEHNWTPATCTAPKTCSVCSATEGTALGHDFADVWSSDASGHWHACSRCDAKDGEATHTPDREAATETDPIKCSECDYIITPALGMQEYTIDLPVSLIVKLTGDEKPAKETFKFEIYDLGCKDAEFKIVNDTVVAENLKFDEEGLAFTGGTLKIKAVGEEQLSNLTEGFSVRMVKGSTKGWTYASEQWRIEPFFQNDALDVGISVKEIVDGEISEVYANGMSFAVSYEAVSEPDPIDPGPINPGPINPGPIDPGPIDPDPTEPDPTEPGTTEPDPTDPGEPANPQPPETGDNSMMGLWTALLFVSGAGVVGITIYGRKKKYSAK